MSNLNKLLDDHKIIIIELTILQQSKISMVWTSNSRPVFVGLLMLQYHDASESRMCLRPQDLWRVCSQASHYYRSVLCQCMYEESRSSPWKLSLMPHVDRSSNCCTSLRAVSSRIHLILAGQLNNVLSLSTDDNHDRPRFSIGIDVSATSSYCRRAGLSIYLQSVLGIFDFIRNGVNFWAPRRSCDVLKLFFLDPRSCIKMSFLSVAPGLV